MSKLKRKILKAGTILAITAFVFIFMGSSLFYSFAFPGLHSSLNFVMSVQNSAETLLFNPVLTIDEIAGEKGFVDFIKADGFRTLIMLLFYLAVVLTPFIDFLIIFSLADIFLLLINSFKDKKCRILIIGRNEGLKSLLNRRNKNVKVYYWTEEYLTADKEREFVFSRVLVKNEEFSLGDSKEEYPEQIKGFNSFMENKKITHVLLIDESDAKNILYYMALSSCDVCKERTIHFHVLSGSFEFRNMLQDYFDEKLTNGKKTDEDTHMDLCIFSFEQIQAELLFSELPVHSCVNETDNKNVHLLIIGGNNLCLHIALHAMNQAVFSPDNRIVIDIVNDKTAGLKQQFINRFDKSMVEEKDLEKDEIHIIGEIVDGELRIRLKEYDLMSDDLAACLQSLQDSECGEFTYVALCSSNVNENLHSLLCINSEKIFSKGKKVPVALRLPYSEEMKKYLAPDEKEKDKKDDSEKDNDFDWCKEIYFMGENEEYIGLDRIINIEEEELIREYNSKYDRVGNKNFCGSSAGQENKDKLWNKLKYYERQSNRALYHHRIVKKDIFTGYDEEMDAFRNLSEQEKMLASKENNAFWSERLVRNNGSGKEEYPTLLKLAKTEHRRWCYYYVSEGWKHGLKKVSEKREHDCLCNWSDLEKNEETKKKLIYDLISSPVLMKDENSKKKTDDK